jgi:hypothetical protein
VPSDHFWLDWRLETSVGTLRRIMPALVETAGCALRERQTMTTSAGWALFDLIAPAVGPDAAVGSMRAQNLADGGAQLFVGPGAQRGDEGAAALNRAALALYCGLLLRGLLPPPSPFQVPAPPLISPEE